MDRAVCGAVQAGTESIGQTIVRYLTGEQVLAIHDYLIEQTGGRHGVRDLQLFLSVLAKPRQSAFGRELYPGLFLKAAVVLEGFANFHVFVDGNKRTAFASGVRMLEMNDYRFTASNTAAENFLVRVATKKLSYADIAAWLKRHSRKAAR